MFAYKSGTEFTSNFSYFSFFCTFLYVWTQLFVEYTNLGYFTDRGRCRDVPITYICNKNEKKLNKNRSIGKLLNKLLRFFSFIYDLFISIESFLIKLVLMISIFASLFVKCMIFYICNQAIPKTFNS